MRSLVLAFFIVILSAAGYVIFYTGMYKEVQISETKAGPFLVLAKKHFGPYHKIVPQIEEVERWVKAAGGDCKRSFGQYFDNPEAVEQERLRSRGGCILENRLEGAPSDFEWDTIPEYQAVMAIFEGSPGVGPIRVYPKVAEYFETKNLKSLPGVMEVYLIHGPKAMTTHYFFPIEGK